MLYDFFRTGIYDRNRDFYVTSSPSMDILISSNLERLLWYLSGCESAAVSELMKQLSETGRYEISDAMRERLGLFFGGYADPEDTENKMRSLFEESGYLIDPHTAVASCVLDTYRKETNDETPAVVASTASPYKFTQAAGRALGLDGSDDFELADMIREKTGVPIPAAVESIRTAPVRHDLVVEVGRMEKAVTDFLGIER